MKQNLPEAFVRRMQRMLGPEYEAFEESYEKTRAQGLRLNGLKGNLAEIETDCRRFFHLRPVPWVKEGFYYDGEERPGKHPYHEAGLYYIQEPSAMSVAELLAPEPGDFVLDLCAAPGGKSTQIAARLQGRGLLVSNEIHPARARILSQNMERMGTANAVVTNMDTAGLTRWFPEFFDKIVADAPCSGEGMFRKDEAAREEWSPDHVALCSRRQSEILDNAAKLLKPGGLLVYSTCTFAPEENEGSIRHFLEKHPEFSVEKRRAYDGFGAGRPEWASDSFEEAEEASDWSALKDTYRLWPHQIEGEGHYLAALRKEGECSRREPQKEGKARSFGLKDKALEKAFLQFCEETLDRSEKGMRSGREQEGTGKEKPAGGLPWEQMPGRYLMFGEQFYYVPEALPDMKGMKVLRPGLHLGTFKKNRFEPSHALALFLKKEEVRYTADFPAGETAVLRYLKGEALEAGSGAGKGWTLVTTDGFSLGWAKQAGGILKNHYPKGLRWM
ncbi:MAG: RsmF rRNA methyltransferase first C-terminal domain-containing protein [Lachnospiraceae bacterium]|nr:RsmF rRNA methyltransferase first C-terminal domain-containing protein [Lachnospiraceae bacterium]